MFILGIETSCDETAAAVIQIKNRKISVLSNVISSQIKIHQKYGGVVPELAARQHTENIIPVIDEALGYETRDKKYEIRNTKLDAIAVTVGPGLATSLMVGVETAKTLAWVWKKPLILINHIEAHLYANWLSNKAPLIRGVGGLRFPVLCLLVSGGHTELILMKDYNKYKIIGQTLDDAAGETFDKIAKMLELPYPGGPHLAKLAIAGQKDKVYVPRPLINSGDFNFSFSGLKSEIHRVLQKQKNSKEDICASAQQAIVDVLIAKTIAAAKKFKVQTVLLAGGVAANKELRQQLETKIKTDLPKTNFSCPELQYCTDNAAMVAAAGYFHYNKDLPPYNLQKIKINPNLSL